MKTTQTITQAAEGNTPQIFTFQRLSVRSIIDEDGQIWFAAIDVCRALNIPWHGKTLARIPDEWKRLMHTRMEGSQARDLAFISEAAVCKLALRSDKPEADALTNWLVSEALPSIRKTGKLEAKPRQKALPPVDHRPYHDRSLDISREKWLSDYNAFARAQNTVETPYRALKESTSKLSSEFHVLKARMYQPLQNICELLDTHAAIGQLIYRTMQDLEPRVPKGRM